MSDRSGAAAIAVILTFALLTAWVPAQWPVYLAEGMVFAVAALWMAVRIVRPGTVVLHLWLAAPVLAAAWGLWQLASGHTVYAWKTWEATFAWAANAAVMFLALQCFSEARERERWLRRFVYFGLAMSVFSVLQLYTSDAKVFWHFTTPRDFVMGTLGYKNHYAAFVELLFPVAIWQAARSRHRALYTAAAGIIAATTVAAVSRAGVALVILELCACLAMLKRRQLISWRAAGLIAAGFTIAGTLFVGVFEWERFERKLETGAEGDTRLLIYRSAVEMVRERPWTGFGLGTWTTVYPAYAHYDRGLFVNAAHNDWLEWAGDGGLPVAAVLGVLAIASAAPAFRSVWGIGIPAVFAHALVDFPFQLPALSLLVFALLGAAGSNKFSSKAQNGLE